MSHLVLTDAKIYLAQYDLSSDHNQIGLNYGAELQDKTVFGDTTRKRAGGLKTVQVNGGGFVSLGDDEVDDVLFGKIGVSDTPLTLSADGGDEGDIAYTLKSILGQYQPGATLGEMLAFTVTAEARGALVRGTVMQNGVETETGESTARQLGAVGSGQKLYAAVHVLAASGSSPTLDVKVRSDDNSGMSSPTDRITFSQFTDVGSAWATPVEGPITDDWFDIEMTLGGTTPSFTIVGVVGIQ